ncbi:tetratricopeptide repeat protein [Chitinophaga sp. LS1]|uniref:tetratricopeptide repeat protein n=1 Tax=Chitinophaga sp. LS1 TaxID=3051176 RepID=UPI002AAABFDC|nr:tetratricopeptide repeat protein [Chitinophaga sp. LS1]WPV67859.1 hypothetical protein QQL36_03865 [Chitinophaga sp. LS1]
MRFYLLVVLMCISIFTSGQQLVPKNSYDQVSSLIAQKQYDKAETQINNLLKTYPGNKSLSLYLLYIYCHKGQYDKAKIQYNALQKIRLDNGETNWLKTQITDPYGPYLFPSSSQPANHTRNLATAASTLPTASHVGKLGIVYNCFDTLSSVDLSQMKSIQELEKRRYTTDQMDKAIATVKAIVGPQNKISSQGRFILVNTQNKLSDSNIRSVANELDKTWQFYTRYFDIAPSNDIITVYLVPNAAELKRMAGIVHGIRAPNVDLGYSCMYDNSILSICNTGTGTLHHELFHIVARKRMTDIPTWLDEGIACLYAVYQWKNDTLYGAYNNWRTQVIQDATYNSTLDMPNRDNTIAVPSLKTLLNYSWDQFNGIIDDNLCKVAINYSLANHLLLYLQQKNLLQKVFNAYKDSTNIPDTTAILIADKDNITPFEKATGEPITITTEKFRNWLIERYHLNEGLSFDENVNPDFNDALQTCQAVIDMIMLERPGGITSKQLRSWREQKEALSDEYITISDADLEKIVRTKDKNPELFNSVTANREKLEALDVLYSKTRQLERTLRSSFFLK